MPQANRKRLLGQKDRVIEMVDLYGRYDHKVLDMFKIKWLPSWDRLINEWTNNPNFGLHSKIPESLTHTLFIQFYSPPLLALKSSLSILFIFLQGFLICWQDLRY